jgi:hypothetical protein
MVVVQVSSLPGKSALDAQTRFVGLDLIEVARIQGRQKTRTQVTLSLTVISP